MLSGSLGSDHEKPPPSLPGAARWMIVERFLLASATGGRAILRAPKRPAESGVAMLRRSGGTGGAVSNTVPGANRTYAFVAPLFGASPTANPVGPTRREFEGPYARATKARTYSHSRTGSRRCGLPLDRRRNRVRRGRGYRTGRSS